MGQPITALVFEFASCCNSQLCVPCAQRKFLNPQLLTNYSSSCALCAPLSACMWAELAAFTASSCARLWASIIASCPGAAPKAAVLLELDVCEVDVVLDTVPLPSSETFWLVLIVSPFFFFVSTEKSPFALLPTAFMMDLACSFQCSRSPDPEAVAK